MGTIFGCSAAEPERNESASVKASEKKQGRYKSKAEEGRTAACSQESKAPQPHRKPRERKKYRAPRNKKGPSHVEISIDCPQQKVGAVIGKGGSTIKSIRVESGAEIRVDTEGGKHHVVIYGTENQVDMAEDLVNNIVSPPKTIIKAQWQQARKLIGPGGATIKALQKRHHAHIHVDKKGGGTCNVVITADRPANLAKAEEAVRAILEPLFRDLLCPNDAVGALIGDDGTNIKELQRACGEAASVDIMDGKGKQRNKHDAKNTTVRVSVAGRDKKELSRCIRLVEAEIKEAVAGLDYMGDEGRKLRAEASAQAHKRTVMYERSHQAYESGDKAGARKLSDAAKAAGEKMRALNKKASEAIFRHRNHGKPDLFIDLHGLTVKEALGFLKSRLHKFLKNDTDDPLECVTGAGHHSPNRSAKIKPAVRELVESMKLRFEVENVGTYIIHC